MELDFEIDKITESIEKTETGERLETFILPIIRTELKTITKKNGWNFDWKSEFNNSESQVYKLVTAKEPDIIQGLVSFEKWDKEKLVYMSLIENAPFNVGNSRIYLGVCGNMVAYGCILSKVYGFGGFLSFDAKTLLIEHYIKTLRAIHYGGQKMGIEPKDAEWLINKYFPEN